MRFGELIQRVELEPVGLLLIMPSFGCHTGDVYREYDQSPLTLDADRVIGMAKTGRVDPDELFNDLALPAQRSQPELGSLMARVGRQTDLARPCFGFGLDTVSCDRFSRYARRGDPVEGAKRAVPRDPDAFGHGEQMSITVGVDLGGTHMQIGVLDESRQVIGRSSGKTHAERGPEAVLDSVATHIQLAMSEAGVQRVRAIGLAAPGAVDHEQGIVVDAPNLNWKDLPAAHLLEERLETPVLLDNDVNAAVYAEQRLGAGRGHDNLLGIWIGTGIGGGLIINGGVYHGQRQTAGEIGHVIIDPHNPLRRRELEHQCSRTAIARDIADAIKDGQSSIAQRVCGQGPAHPVG